MPFRFEKEKFLSSSKAVGRRRVEGGGKTRRDDEPSGVMQREKLRKVESEFRWFYDFSVLSTLHVEFIEIKYLRPTRSVNELRGQWCPKAVQLELKINCCFWS